MIYFSDFGLLLFRFTYNSQKSQIFLFPLLSQVYLASNAPGQGQLLNSAILTGVGQAPTNGAMNQRIVAVGGTDSRRDSAIKVEPVDNEPARLDGDRASHSSTSASELGTDASEEAGRQALTNQPEQIVIKQEPDAGSYFAHFLALFHVVSGIIS